MWLQNLRTTFPQLQSKLHDCSCIALHLFFLDKLYLATNISQLKGNTSYFWNCTLEEDVHVVIVFDFLDVLHSALTHFNFTSVEYLVKGVIFWEMNIYSVRKRLVYFHFDTFTAQQVKPYNVRLAIFVLVFLVTYPQSTVNYK